MFLKENITHNYTVYFDVDDTLSDYTGNLKSSNILPKDTAKNKDFWLSASVIPGTQDLVKYCKNTFENVEVLSAVPTLSKEKQEVLGMEFYEQATEGKEEWLKQNFGDTKCIWVKDGKSKNQYAKENAILIDDKANNIKHWESAGGVGILFDNASNVKAKLQSLQKPLNEGFIPNNYQDNIKGLLMYAHGSGYNVEPFPKIKFIRDDTENSENFIGKTSYYDPNNLEIVLYTMGRDPIAIEEDFCVMLMKHINHLDKMKELENIIFDVTEFMSSQGYSTSIPPKIRYIHDDPHNDFKDIINIKSAYYNPSNKEIVLYTKNRHPRDIVSSYCHEYIHMVQDEEGRLNNISGENVLDSKELEIIEREAYENGGFMFRAFKDFMKK